MATIIDGKAVAAQIKEGVAREVEALKSKGVTPKLTVVLVGEDPASKVYVASKGKTCAELGLGSDTIIKPIDITQEDLEKLIVSLNNDPEVNGILVQLPLPDHLDSQRVLNLIDPDKDVDGFHPVNLGRLVVGETGFVPCTPKGIIELIKNSGMEIKGKEAVVVGRSNIVGKPVALLLLHEHATVTVCHSRTRDLGEVTRRADILVAAVGVPEMIKGDMVKDGAVVIDVGVNRVDGKLLGDVDFEGASKKASAITPVPGGVGPMTIAMLMQNTLIAAKRQNNIV